jgi:hypothetical protein
MSAIRRIRTWLGRLVHRPADLFDIASGLTTLLFVLVLAWNHDNSATPPSLSFLSDKAPSWLWLLVIGALAALQPVALHLDDPGDTRHPLLQWRKWLRNLLALCIGCWFLILTWSMAARLGLHHFEVLYALLVGMNAYIVAHVLFRARG